MKKILLFVLFFVGVMTVRAQFSGGNGTEANPFIITSPAQLDNVRNYRNSHFALGTTINLSSYISSTYPINGWEPIGTENAPFIGSLDGRCYKIEGLWINRPNEDNIGLFGVMQGAKIKRLGVIGSHSYPIIGRDNVGILTGTYIKSPPTNSSVDIDQCFVLSQNIQGNDNVGGMIGYANSVYVRYSSSRVFMTGKHKIGGFIGDANRVYADYCYAQGIIYNYYEHGEWYCIDDNGDVVCGYAGGFAGHLDALGTKLKRCYTACKMLNWSLPEVPLRIGGIFGFGSYTANNQGPEYYPIWDYELSGESPLAIDPKNIICSGLMNNYTCGGNGFTTSEMKNLNFWQSEFQFQFQYIIPDTNTFINMLPGYSPATNCMPPNLPYIWGIINNQSYPFLFNEMAYGAEIIEFMNIMDSYPGNFPTKSPNTKGDNSMNSLLLEKKNISPMNTSLFPNPTTGIVSITGEDLNVKVYDSKGILLIETKSNTVDLSAYPSGIYIFNINGKVEKVIKQ